jgi:hypothetical protein
MESNALREPVAVGVNFTLIAQLFSTATLAPQVLVSAKSPGLAPPMLMLEMFNAALPVLDSVTLCAALVVPTLCEPKVRLPTDRLAAGAAPVPLRLTVWGLPPALSAIASDALRVPAAVGVNVTLIAQLLSAATLLPQVLVSAKSPGFVPPMLMLAMFSVASLVLESVTL